jgi:hypothetical protein
MILRVALRACYGAAAIRTSGFSLWRGSLDRYCNGVMLESQVLMAVTELRTTASAKEQK